jgi:hypothetical protein
MGQKTDQIERHIEAQRAQLGENIDELQQRVKDTFDWRTQLEQRPMVMLGIAVGGGLLLSAIVGGRRSRSRNTDRLPTTAETGKTARSFSGNRDQVSHPSESWRDIRNALIGVATAQLGTALDSVIPGFSKQYDKARADGASQAAQSL